jgi:hypothetical protein
MVKALFYKPEGSEFENRWGEWMFSIYLIFQVALGSGDHPASNRHEYQKQKSTVSGSKVRPVCRAGNLAAIYEPIV